MPDPAQSAECCPTQSMKVLEAASLLSSDFWFISTKLCPSAHTAGVSPTVGRKPMLQCRFGAVVFRSLICQMPSQVMALRPVLKALYWVSRATFFGLWPFLIWSVIQVSAVTPASESKAALPASEVNGVPPFCQSSDRKIRWAGHWLGIQKGCRAAPAASFDRAVPKSWDGSWTPAFFVRSVFQYEARLWTSSG